MYIQKLLISKDRSFHKNIANARVRASVPIYQIIEELNGTGCDLRAKLYKYIHP